MLTDLGLRVRDALILLSMDVDTLRRLPTDIRVGLEVDGDALAIALNIKNAAQTWEQ